MLRCDANSPARPELPAALPAIAHTQKHPVRERHFWVRVFFQISLFIFIVKGITVL